MIIGSSGNIKPSKKRNWYKVLTWSAIALITVTLVVIWIAALNRFQ